MKNKQAIILPDPYAWVSLNVLTGNERIEKFPIQSLQSGVYQHKKLYTESQVVELIHSHIDKKDPEAWRDEYRKKQAAGVKFEYHWPLSGWRPGSWNFKQGNKEDYREVQEAAKPIADTEVKDGGVWIPEAAREILKGWHKQGLKFNCGEIFLCLEKPQFNDMHDYYTINKQPIPEGMSAETIEDMWRKGLMLEFNTRFDGIWVNIAEAFNWHGDTYQLLKRLRIPAQPIPEKLLEVPPEVSGTEHARAEPHAAERALWKAQREAGTNEVWQSLKNKSTYDIPVDQEPMWVPRCTYRVKPMKLTAKIIRRGVYKTSYYWEFTGTREEYRAECEKYGYVVVSEIKEVVEKPKTVTYYFALYKTSHGYITSISGHAKDWVNEWITDNGHTIIGDIEAREVEA